MASAPFLPFILALSHSKIKFRTDFLDFIHNYLSTFSKIHAKSMHKLLFCAILKLSLSWARRLLTCSV